MARNGGGGENSLESNGLRPVRCSTCGRFLGYAAVKDGVVLMLCKNCSGWAVIAEGATGSQLTTQEIYDMLPQKGQKG